MTTSDNSSVLKGIAPLRSTGVNSGFVTLLFKVCDCVLQMSLLMLMCGHLTKRQTIQNHLYSSYRKWEPR